MNDVYLWTGLAVASLVAAAAVVALVRRWLDWQDRRTATAPTVFHTEVWLPGELQAPATELEMPAPDSTPADVSAWALAALADARKDAADTYATLGEFARPVATAPALIWAEIDGTARGRELWAQWRPDWIGATA